MCNDSPPPAFHPAQVTVVEGEVQSAHVTAKRAREALALAQREVASNLRIARNTRRKQGLTALLEALLRLQQANNLQRALKCECFLLLVALSPAPLAVFL
jgi:hypothetical protein